MKPRYQFTFCFIIVSFLSISLAFSQQDFRGTTTYLELDGAGGPHVSLNVEHSLVHFLKWQVNGRIGYGMSKIQGSMLNCVPIGFHTFYGLKNSHLEIGTIVAYSEGRQYVVGLNVYSKAIYFIPSLSYRFQKPTGGLFFRIGYTPLFKLKEYEESFAYIKRNHAFGIAIGYFFGQKIK